MLRYAFVTLYFACTLLFDVFAILPKILPGRTWTYEALGVETTSSNEELMKIHLYLVRIKRGEFAMSGYMNWNYDVGNDTYMEMTAFRSSTGSNDYKQMPFGMPRIEYYKYTNTIYRDIIIPNFNECTNFPVFKKKLEGPWPQKNYTFDRCQPNGDGLPYIMQEGYYLLKISCTGKVDWTITFFLKVEPALY